MPSDKLPEDTTPEDLNDDNEPRDPIDAAIEEHRDDVGSDQFREEVHAAIDDELNQMEEEGLITRGLR